MYMHVLHVCVVLHTYIIFIKHDGFQSVGSFALPFAKKIEILPIIMGLYSKIIKEKKDLGTVLSKGIEGHFQKIN